MGKKRRGQDGKEEQDGAKGTEELVKEYVRPEIYLTENGCDVRGESVLPLQAPPGRPSALRDHFRIECVCVLNVDELLWASGGYSSMS